MTPFRPSDPCPAGGEHRFGEVEENGTGRTAIACVECGTTPQNARWDLLEHEAGSEDHRCPCGRLARGSQDLCDGCLEADERTWGGDAA